MRLLSQVGAMMRDGYRVHGSLLPDTKLLVIDQFRNSSQGQFDGRVCLHEVQIADQATDTGPTDGSSGAAANGGRASEDFENAVLHNSAQFYRCRPPPLQINMSEPTAMIRCEFA